MRPPSRALAAALLLASLGACSHSTGRATSAPSPSATDFGTFLYTPLPTPSPTASPSARPSAAARSARMSPSPSAAPPVFAGKAARYVFPIRGCRTSYGHSHHDYPATDIFAARGCRVVSPVAGVVDEVSTVDRWSSSTNRGADRGGIAFSVVGVDGVRYYGSHLSTVVVRPGQHVIAGQKLGTVGNTGSARGIATHLHFGISWPTRHGVWWVRRGEVYPWPYLDSWRAGRQRSPASAVAAKHRQMGDVPPCTSYC